MSVAAENLTPHEFDRYAALVEFFKAPREEYTARELAAIEGTEPADVDAFIRGTLPYLIKSGEISPLPRKGREARRFSRSAIIARLASRYAPFPPATVCTAILRSGCTEVPVALVRAWVLNLSDRATTLQTCEHHWVDPFGRNVYCCNCGVSRCPHPPGYRMVAGAREICTSCLYSPQAEHGPNHVQRAAPPVSKLATPVMLPLPIPLS